MADALLASTALAVASPVVAGLPLAALFTALSATATMADGGAGRRWLWRGWRDQQPDRPRRCGWCGAFNCGGGGGGGERAQRAAWAASAAARRRLGGGGAGGASAGSAGAAGGDELVDSAAVAAAAAEVRTVSSAPRFREPPRAAAPAGRADTGFPTACGDGGGGGAGGYGAVVTGTGSLGTLGSAVTGGRGGDGGEGSVGRQRWNRRVRAPLYQCRGRHVHGQRRRAGRRWWPRGELGWVTDGRAVQAAPASSART